MITLTLLHPLQSVPVQSWSFDNDSLIRVGRATDNNVILYSAVVSRHHVELRRDDSGWKVINVGANGTYVDGKRVDHLKIVNGMIIRLASSGPKIQIHIGSSESHGNENSAQGKRRKSRLTQISKDTLVN